MVVFSSLTTRLVALVVITIAISLSAIVAVTAYRLERGARLHESSVRELIRNRVAKEVQLQTRIVLTEFERLETETADSLAAIASRPETAKVLHRGNIVAIDLMLQSALKTGALDSVVAFDVSLKPLGSHQPGLPLIITSDVFSRSAKSKLARHLIQTNDRQSVRSNLSFISTNKSYMEAFGLKQGEKGFLLIGIHPVFDDFGDVAAVLVGHRVVELSEKFLAKYLRTESLGIRILDGDSVLLGVGLSPGNDRYSSRSELGKMKTTSDGSMLFQCAAFKGTWRLCIYEPVEHLADLTGALFQFIDDEKNSLWRWLALLAISAVAVSTLLATYATRRVLAPLTQIAGAVRSVADGNWLVHVSGQRRRDEVGGMARAVVDLQKSMKERERLKADVADIEEMHQRHKCMEEAVEVCRAGLRTHVFSLSDKAESAETSAARLESLTGLAEGESDEARLIAHRAFASLNRLNENEEGGSSSERDIIGSIDRLGETVAQISVGTRDLSSNIGTTIQEVRGMDRVVKSFLKTIGKEERTIPMNGQDASPRETLSAT